MHELKDLLLYFNIFRRRFDNPIGVLGVAHLSDIPNATERGVRIDLRDLPLLNQSRETLRVPRLRLVERGLTHIDLKGVNPCLSSGECDARTHGSCTNDGD